MNNTLSPAQRDLPLLDPAQLGPYLLKNRFVLPPMTRSRAGAGDVPTALHTIYYAQRATAGLIITEGAPISQQGTGFPWTPGIYSDEQVAGWQNVVDEVHRRDSRIFLQLWHVGRQSHTSLQENNALPVAPSAVAVSGQIFTADGMQDFETPRSLETEEIADIVKQFGVAARNAKAAGFDGVEIHGASGYLIDQFLCTSSNRRVDEYGGSIENRVRFLGEVIDEVVSVWGADRVGVRLTPSSRYGDMLSEDKREVYTAAVHEIGSRGLAYLHLVDPSIRGAETVELPEDAIPTGYFRSIFDGTLIVTGGMTFDAADEVVSSGEGDLIGFGKLYMSHPDLPVVYERGGDTRDPDRTYYYGGDETGYTDYPSLRDADYYESLIGRIDAGGMDRETALRSLEAVDPLTQIDSGAYYARLRLRREA